MSTATVPKPKSRRVGRQTHEPRSATRRTSRQTQPRRSKGPRRFTACLWAAVFGLLGTFFLSRGTERPLGRYAPAPAPAVAAAQQEYVTKPIRDIQMGEWVLAENPELSDSERARFDEIDPATWRKMSLRMEKSDGSLLDIDLLRAAGWLKTNGVAVGSTIHLDLPEMGAAGPAEVLSVGPCPELAPRPSPRCQIVTGKFSHSSGEILDVHVEGLDAPIGTTAIHAFWSEDRQAFIAAGELRPGEKLRTAAGTLRSVTAIAPRMTRERVYNLEVDWEHVYHVSQSGILVHNPYHGYVIIDETTGEVLKYGVSRRGYRASGQSIRATEQFTRIARELGIPRGNLTSFVLSEFPSSADMFLWERLTVGAHRHMYGEWTLPLNLLPKGTWPP